MKQYRLKSDEEIEKTLDETGACRCYSWREEIWRHIGRDWIDDAFPSNGETYNLKGYIVPKEWVEESISTLEAVNRLALEMRQMAVILSRCEGEGVEKDAIEQMDAIDRILEEMDA